MLIWTSLSLCWRDGGTRLSKFKQRKRHKLRPLLKLCLTCLRIINLIRFTSCAHSGSWSSAVFWDGIVTLLTVEYYHLNSSLQTVPQMDNLLKCFPKKFTHSHNNPSRKLPLFMSGRTLCSNKNHHTREDERTNQYRFPTASLNHIFPLFFKSTWLERKAALKKRIIIKQKKLYFAWKVIF